MRKRSNYYIDNSVFYELLKDYLSMKKNNPKKPAVFNEIGKRFLLISKNIIRRPNFVNYDENLKCDMMSDAVYTMVKYIDRYNLEKTNPLAFFSQFAFNAFIQNINKMKKLSRRYISLDQIENMTNPEEDLD